VARDAGLEGYSNLTRRVRRNGMPVAKMHVAYVCPISRPWQGQPSANRTNVPVGRTPGPCRCYPMTPWVNLTLRRRQG
jgi:hypothetical protein